MTTEIAHGIWVFAEQTDGVLAPVTLELLAKAQELKAACGEAVTAVLLGYGAEHLTETLIAHGADEVLLAEHPALSQYKPRPYKTALVELAQRHRPAILLLPATPLGRDLAPRVMCALNTGLTADAVGLSFDGDGVFVHTTPAYGGTVLVDIAIPERRPQMVTVRPQVFAPLPADLSRTGRVLRETVSVEDDPDYVVLETVEKPAEGVPLPQARVVVSGGRGVKDREDLDRLRRLAELLGGQLGCSRPLCDSGWLPHDAQIGQSGATVQPDFLLNMAVSGAGQYVSGTERAKCVMSINHTVGAPIFAVSHYGVEADYRTVLPALLRELERRKHGPAAERST